MSLAEEFGSLLRSKAKTIAAAESCTGGKVGDVITSVPGSSDYFLGGIVSYSDRAKVSLLGVDQGVLGAEGAVSEKVALQMARGARKAFGADIGVSTTGIAGPGGGSPSKPVGLVYIAVSTEGREACRRYTFQGSREDIKTSSCASALALVVDVLAEAR